MTADMLARLRAVIEEELGDFRPFAELPSVEIETIADRLARAVAPLVEAAGPVERRDAA